MNLNRRQNDQTLLGSVNLENHDDDEVALLKHICNRERRGSGTVEGAALSPPLLRQMAVQEYQQSVRASLIKKRTPGPDDGLDSAQPQLPLPNSEKYLNNVNTDPISLESFVLPELPMLRGNNTTDFLNVNPSSERVAELNKDRDHRHGGSSTANLRRCGSTEANIREFSNVLSQVDSTLTREPTLRFLAHKSKPATLPRVPRPKPATLPSRPGAYSASPGTRLSRLIKQKSLRFSIFGRGTLHATTEWAKAEATVEDQNANSNNEHEELNRHLSVVEEVITSKDADNEGETEPSDTPLSTIADAPMITTTYLEGADNEDENEQPDTLPSGIEADTPMIPKTYLEGADNEDEHEQPDTLPSGIEADTPMIPKTYLEGADNEDEHEQPDTLPSGIEADTPMIPKAYLVQSHEEVQEQVRRLSSQLNRVNSIIDQKALSPKNNKYHQKSPWVRMALRMSSPDIDSQVLVKRSTFVLGVVLKLFCCPVWAAVLAVMGDLKAAFCPFLYMLLNGGALVYALVEDNTYDFFVETELVLIFLLPLVVQFVQGGVTESGNIMQWSFLAPLGAVYFRSVQESWRWFQAYLGVSLLALLLEWHFGSSTSGVSLIYFAMNNVGVLSIVFACAYHFACAHENDSRLKED